MKQDFQGREEMGADVGVEVGAETELDFSECFSRTIPEPRFETYEPMWRREKGTEESKCPIYHLQKAMFDSFYLGSIGGKDDNGQEIVVHRVREENSNVTNYGLPAITEEEFWEEVGSKVVVQCSDDACGDGIADAHRILAGDADGAEHRGG